MRLLAGLALALAVAACGDEQPPSPAPAPTAPAEQAATTPVGDGNDCAVMGAVAREHYGATRDDPPSRVTLDGEELYSRWMADCDWHEMGVNYVLDEGPTTPAAIMSYAHVSFRKPVYDGNGARVITQITPPPQMPDASPAPLTECRLVSGVAAWTVLGCEAVQ